MVNDLYLIIRVLYSYYIH